MLRGVITGNIVPTLVAISRPAVKQNLNFTQMGKGIISNIMQTLVAASRAVIKENLNLNFTQMGKGIISVISCQSK